MSLSYRLAIHRDGAADAPAVRAWSLDDLRAASVDAALADDFTLGEGDAAAITAAQVALEAEERARTELEAERAARDHELAAAYERGCTDGRIEGELAERARLRTIARAAEQALAEIREHEERWVGAMEPNVAALAVAVARQLVARELDADPTVVDALVRSALAEFPIDQPIRVRVNPTDLERLSAIGAHVTAVEGRGASWIADAALTPGSCVVEGRERIVDGRVDTALERLYRRLVYQSE